MAFTVEKDVLDRYLRPKLRELLSQCTAKQQVFFVRLYPDGVDKMVAEKIPWAIGQCERTIKENEAKDE